MSRCCFVFVYMFIDPSQSTRDTSIVQLLPVLRFVAGAYIQQLQLHFDGVRSESAHMNTLIML